MPRKPLGDKPLTLAERSDRFRARRAAKERELLATINRILSARTIGEAREIAASVIVRSAETDN
jgi:hypothetical protein